MSNSQEGKTALITGSYGGLGTQFVNIHASNGGNLILVGRNPKKLKDQQKEVLQKHNVRAHIIDVDFSKPEAAQIIYDTCKKNGWKVDYLINNAGFGGQGKFIKHSMEEDMSMIAVNIETPTRLAKLFLPDFVKRGSGKLLNVSSTAAVIPGSLQAVYYATKAYLTSWSDALWREVQGTGVTVTCLMPGAMQTGFISRGDLSSTQLFANAVKPNTVAKAGYEGMLAGKLNVTAGLTAMQKPFMAMAPMLPKKMMMNNVYKMQEQGSRKK